MDQPAGQENPRQKLIRTISELGAKAYSPQSNVASREDAEREFDEFIQR